jgi:probable rRNA maturation factor
MTLPNTASLPDIQTDVNVLHPAWPDISDLLENIREAMSEHLVFQDYIGRDVEISIVLADNLFVRNLNKEYRGKDKPTNVLSFPQDPEPGAKMINLGDVVMAFETVQLEAESQGKEFNDHVTHLLVHGILHLLAYDHEDDEEAEEMESLEIRVLERLGIKNPYEDIVE